MNLWIAGLFGVLSLSSSPQLTQMPLGATVLLDQSLEHDRHVAIIEVRGVCCAFDEEWPSARCYLWLTSPGGSFVEKLESCPRSAK